MTHVEAANRFNAEGSRRASADRCCKRRRREQADQLHVDADRNDCQHHLLLASGGRPSPRISLSRLGVDLGLPRFPGRDEKIRHRAREIDR
jgi:hypothetical protein